jgi:signal transduction histidine kinase
VTSSVGHGLQLDHVLGAALESTLDVIGLKSGWIYLREEESDRFFLTTAIAPPALIVKDSPAISPASCDCQKRLLSPEAIQEPSIHVCGRLKDLELLSGVTARHLTVPLSTRGESLGVMNLLWVKSREPYQEELELLDAIGVQVSEAVASARLHDNLRREEAGRRALMASLATAQEDERARLSAELHDGTGQELTSLLLRLKTLEYEEDGKDFGLRVEDLCTDLSGSIERLRELSHQLRPPDLEQLGLGPAMRNLAEDMFGGQPIQCQIKCRLAGQSMPDGVQISLYRIAQEALTNIVRHSRASSVVISCGLDHGWAELKIEDNGVGFNPDDLADDGQTHFGLASIQERAERLGGSLEVQTALGAGTSLQVFIPVLEEALV